MMTSCCDRCAKLDDSLEKIWFVSASHLLQVCYDDYATVSVGQSLPVRETGRGRFFNGSPVRLTHHCRSDKMGVAQKKRSSRRRSASGAAGRQPARISRQGDRASADGKEHGGAGSGEPLETGGHLEQASWCHILGRRLCGDVWAGSRNERYPYGADRFLHGAGLERAGVRIGSARVPGNGDAEWPSPPGVRESAEQKERLGGPAEDIPGEVGLLRNDSGGRSFSRPARGGEPVRRFLEAAWC